MGLPFDEGRVGVLGCGIIGGGLLKALHAKGLHCWGYDADPDTMRALAREGIELATSADDLILGSSMLVLAVPHEQMPALVQYALALSDTAVVTTTGPVFAPLEALPLPDDHRARLVIGHPMCGSEQAGFAAADPQIFHGATWVLCPFALHAAVHVSQMVDDTGAYTLFLDARSHDESTAYASHITHLVSAALIQLAPPHLRMRTMLTSGGGLRDMTRIADGAPEPWISIARDNRNNIRQAVDDLLVMLDRVAEDLERVDLDGLADVHTLLAEGQRARAALHRRRWSEAQFVPLQLGADLSELYRRGRDGMLLRSLHFERDDELVGEGCQPA